MLFRHRRRTIPALNTTSTADISFMLLIFFLVTTSMDMDKGLMRQLPPDNSKQEEVELDVDKRNVLKLVLDGENQLMVDDNIADIGQLRKRVVTFLAKCPDREHHVITVDVDPKAHYDAYFNMQNEIVAAYRAMREAMAQRMYGQSFNQCSDQQKEALRAFVPQRIAEVYEH